MYCYFGPDLFFSHLIIKFKSITMATSNLVTIKFKSRNANNQSDKGIAEKYSDGEPFDVELQTSDGKSVPVHRFVLATFSKTWANTLRNVGWDGVIVCKLVF